MARPLRIQLKGALYHITSRGNEGKKIFYTNKDKYKFIEYLLLTKKKFKLKIYAYVLMDNHYHLLLETTSSNLSSSIHYLNTSYVTYLNIKRKRSGHLFQGRYKSIIVDKDNYLLALVRYIHLNPIKIGKVNNLEDYPFSSYNAYLKEDDELVDTKDVLLQFSKDTEKAKLLYKKFLEEGIKNKLDSPLNKVVSSCILGKEEFIDKIKRIIRKKGIKGEVVKKRGLLSKHKEEDILKYVSDYYKVPLHDLYKNPEAKKIGIYLLKENTDLTLSNIGKLFNISYSAVSQIVRRMTKTKELEKDISRIKDIMMSNVKD